MDRIYPKIFTAMANTITENFHSHTPKDLPQGKKEVARVK
jgi:hypothetical protein